MVCIENIWLSPAKAGESFLDRYTRLAQASRCGSVTLGGKQSTGLFSNTLAPLRTKALRYPERAKELFAKAEETAKAKYERLKKLVEFYND